MSQSSSSSPLTELVPSVLEDGGRRWYPRFCHCCWSRTEACISPGITSGREDCEVCCTLCLILAEAENLVLLATWEVIPWGSEITSLSSPWINRYRYLKCLCIRYWASTLGACCWENLQTSPDVKNHILKVNSYQVVYINMQMDKLDVCKLDDRSCDLSKGPRSNRNPESWITWAVLHIMCNEIYTYWLGTCLCFSFIVFQTHVIHYFGH